MEKRKREISIEESKGRNLQYQRDEDIDPLKLIENAGLALHHHMAPADGSFDFGSPDECE